MKGVGNCRTARDAEAAEAMERGRPGVYHGGHMRGATPSRVAMGIAARCRTLSQVAGCLEHAAMPLSPTQAPPMHCGNISPLRPPPATQQPLIIAPSAAAQRGAEGACMQPLLCRIQSQELGVAMPCLEADLLGQAALRRYRAQIAHRVPAAGEMLLAWRAGKSSGRVQLHAARRDDCEPIC